MKENVLCSVELITADSVGLPEEEGNPCLYFFFPDTTVEHKNKLETRRALGSTLVRVFSAKAKKHKPCYLRDFLSLFFLNTSVVGTKGEDFETKRKKKKRTFGKEVLRQ